MNLLKKRKNKIYLLESVSQTDKASLTTIFQIRILSKKR
jgi:hypothetical protein